MSSPIALQDQVFDLDALQQRADDDGRAAGLSGGPRGRRRHGRTGVLRQSLARRAGGGLQLGDGRRRFERAVLRRPPRPAPICPTCSGSTADRHARGHRWRQGPQPRLDHPPSSDLGVLRSALFIGSDQAPAKVSTPVPPSSGRRAVPRPMAPSVLSAGTSRCRHGSILDWSPGPSRNGTATATPRIAVARSSASTPSCTFGR